MQGGTARGREVLGDEGGRDHAPQICKEQPAACWASAPQAGLLLYLHPPKKAPPAPRLFTGELERARSSQAGRHHVLPIRAKALVPLGQALTSHGVVALQGERVVLDGAGAHEVELAQAAGGGEVADVLEGRADGAPALVVGVVALYLHHLHRGPCGAVGHCSPPGPHCAARPPPGSTLPPMT